MRRPQPFSAPLPSPRPSRARLRGCPGGFRDGAKEHPRLGPLQKPGRPAEAEEAAEGRFPPLSRAFPGTHSGKRPATATARPYPPPLPALDGTTGPPLAPRGGSAAAKPPSTRFFLLSEPHRRRPPRPRLSPQRRDLTSPGCDARARLSRAPPCRSHPSRDERANQPLPGKAGWHH